VQCGARIEASGERDADLLADGDLVEDSRHGSAWGGAEMLYSSRRSRTAGFVRPDPKPAFVIAIVSMPSFDIVSEVNQVELRNALDQANKEISTRYDFKGSDARVEHKEKELTLYADNEFKLKQVTDVLVGKLARRNVDVRSLKFGSIEKIGGDKVKQVAALRIGIEQELAKKIVKAIKDSKLKVQATIQGDAVRVSGAKKDELQSAIALVRKAVTDIPVQFGNFRD
jgi:hypothetical protein